MNDLALLGWVLRAALVVALVTAVGGALLPGAVGTASSVVCIAVLIGAPVVRVAWLTVDWFREGDRRFARLGSALLLVLAASGVVALL